MYVVYILEDEINISTIGYCRFDDRDLSLIEFQLFFNNIISEKQYCMTTVNILCAYNLDLGKY